MRLLNVETMKMEEFFDDAVPLYAILSHRWGPEEVSLQEWNRVEQIEDKMQAMSTHDAFKAARHEHDFYHESLLEQYSELKRETVAIKRRIGYSKIVSCTELVRNQIIWEHQDATCGYVWIDTCCIDKTNHAELSEAINSMFRWYKNSFLCLVYLADVPTGLGPEEMEYKVRASNWFERGWTLQELLAPDDVRFFDQGWKFLFDKEQQSHLIGDITRIDEDVLWGCETLSETCTAKKDVLGCYSENDTKGRSSLLSTWYFRHQHAVTVRRGRESVCAPAGRNYPAVRRPQHLCLGLQRAHGLRNQRNLCSLASLFHWMLQFHKGQASAGCYVYDQRNSECAAQLPQTKHRAPGFHICRSRVL